MSKEKGIARFNVLIDLQSQAERGWSIYGEKFMRNIDMEPGISVDGVARDLFSPSSFSSPLLPSSSNQSQTNVLLHGLHYSSTLLIA